MLPLVGRCTRCRRQQREDKKSPPHPLIFEGTIGDVTLYSGGMAGAEVKAAQLPQRIGRHQVVGYIATGGMAELFLGKEPSGRPVVIKRILPHLARQASFVSMFVDEAR